MSEARVGLGTIARAWGRIGCVGLGGPPAHIALLRRLCVERRRWLDAEQFEDDVAATHVLPGPASTQLAILTAWRLRGTPGALVGGACFVAPGLLAVLALAVLFLADEPPRWVSGAAAGLGAVVAAVALHAAWRLAPASRRRATGRAAACRWYGYLAVGAVAAVLAGPWLVLVLVLAGLCEATVTARARRGPVRAAESGGAPADGADAPADTPRGVDGDGADPPGAASRAGGERPTTGGADPGGADTGSRPARRTVAPSSGAPSSGAPSSGAPSSGDRRVRGADTATWAAWLLPLAASAAGVAGGLAALLWVAFKVGALSFGGGFVIVPLMQADAVDTHHWTTGGQFLDAVALGQLTPGPLLHTVAVVGYAAAGLLGGLLAALVAFAPSFLMVLHGGRHLDRLRRLPGVRAFLRGAGPTVVGTVAGSAVPLALDLTFAWQYGMLAAAVVWLLAARRGVVSALVGAGVLGVVIAVAGGPVG